MPLEPGTGLGDFEIQSLLGEGGMGQVYRARDTRLNRAVALKVLPDAFTRDADRLARFKREAQVLASLNHPNIGAIYGLEQSQQIQALVLELVDGPTLAEMIEGSGRHALPVDEALAIARQIADALEAAHEQGIIHRDLKPANVKVRDDGRVKVLDFGLAKALDQEVGARSQEAAGRAEAPAALSISPTITSPAMTAVGIILGTAAYMAPEQAKGKPADKRSDIWAFGAVLYEMLTGRRAFHGEDISDTLAEVLRGEPDWSALPGNVPEHIKLLLRRCLERDRTKRVSDIGVARFLLTESIPAAAPSPTAVHAAASRSVWRRALPAVAAAVGSAAIIAAGFWFARPSQPAAVVTRFGYSLKEGQRFTNSGRHVLAIAPDGTRVAFVANTQVF